MEQTDYYKVKLELLLEQSQELFVKHEKEEISDAEFIVAIDKIHTMHYNTFLDSRNPDRMKVVPDYIH